MLAPSKSSLGSILRIFESWKKEHCPPSLIRLVAAVWNARSMLF
jgi:hypothetical protein